MKISERCKKQIEDIERIANEFKVTGKREPYDVVLWNSDLESISELYLAYKSLEVENEKLKHDVKKLQWHNDNQFKLINTLKDCNDKQYNQIERQREKYKEQCNQLHTIKKSFEVLRALYLGEYENDDEPF